VVSPRAADLAPLLERAGAIVTRAEGALSVTSMEAPQIGNLAAANGIEVHELATRRASLEAAFMELTESSLQYQADAKKIASVA